ncbi:hypothetical protein ACFLV7_09560 [Chloroflexota bacterium]
MYPLEVMFPRVRDIRIPITRDQTMLVMAAITLIGLGVETYLAHLISGTIVPYEWIPIIFGPAAGILLIGAGFLAIRNRSLATSIASIVFLSSILVGLLGAYFHTVRAILPYAQPGSQVSVPLLVWAPPILGPLTFSLIGLVGLSAAWIEHPSDSGTLILLGGRKINLPYSKTRAYFFITGLAALATVISSVLDHARTDFSNPWLWVPTAVGVFTTVVAVVLGTLEHPSRADLFTYLFAMLLMIVVGNVGLVLHISQNLTTQGVIVGERFIRGAPFLAPLLFTNIGAIGLIALMNPTERGLDTI